MGVDLVSKVLKSFLLTVVLFTVLSSETSYAMDSKDLNMNLSGVWDIYLSDHLPLSEKNIEAETSWGTIILPGNIALYSNKKTGKTIGTAWLKKTITIPKDWTGQDIGLTLGRISHADETFFNGEKIGETGSFPPDEASMWNIPRHYYIPHRLIKPGAENVITLRIWFHTYGDIVGELGLSDYQNWKNDKDQVFFVRIITNYMIIAMALPLLMIFILFYIQRQSSTEYFYYILQLLCGLFIILDMCSLWHFPGGINFRFKLLAFSWIALNVVHPVFLHRLYKLQRRKIELVLVGFFLSALPCLFLTTELYFKPMGLLIVILCSFIGLYNLSCHFSAIWFKTPYSKLFSLFGIIVILGALHDACIYLSKLAYLKPSFLGYTFDKMAFPFGASALYTGTAIILVYRFTELLKSNEDLNENLENKVSERTCSLILLTEKLEKQNIKLGEMAIRDSLTGLYNHAAFCARLDEIFMTSRTNKSPMGVAMIDVDDFKGVNDTYGHQIGDEVLGIISNILKTSVREYDFLEKYMNQRMGDNRDYDLAGRYGGDEFIMVLPGCNKDFAVKVTERICELINQSRIKNHPEMRISVSFGLAVLTPDIKCTNSEKLINLADIALYKSKAMGKNRVHCKVYKNKSNYSA